MVTILRYFNGQKYVFKLRDKNKKRLAPWFNTMGAARKYAESLGLNIIERPDLIKKWSSPHLNRIIA